MGVVTAAEKDDAAPARAVEVSPAAAYDDTSAIASRGVASGPPDRSAYAAGRLLRRKALSHSANAPVRAATLRGVQATHGNRVAQRAVAERRQPLMVSQPGDPLEQEASRAADLVVSRQAGAPVSLATDGTTGPHRSAAAADISMEADVHESLGSGRPLDRGIRASMEAGFGRTFDDVRIHTGEAAAHAAAAVDARAYTLGRDIVFGRDGFNPHTTDGQRLLAHELAHVAQAPDSRTLRRQPDNASEEPDDEPEEKAPVRPGLVMSMSEMCGPSGCFDDSKIYGELERSRAEDVAAEARATAERKRRRDIRVHGTKQQKWELEFETYYYRFKGVGAVAGTRDGGIMTPSGVRVPAEPGDYLSPRPFYERRSSAFLAWQGFIHYAELVEVGLDGAARVMALQTNGGFPLRDDQLNLAGFMKWTYKAKSARESVEAAILLASGITAVQQLLARAAAGTFARNFGSIARTPPGAAGAQITVEGVAFDGVRVYRTGGEYFTGYDFIINVGRVPNQGKAMHAAFELGTVQAARQAGATTARVGVTNVQNEIWKAHLRAQGYHWEMIQVGPNRVTGFWSKVFNL